MANCEEAKNISKNFYQVFPSKVKTKICEADAFCNHLFDILGSGQKKISSKGPGYKSIDWHSDIKSGYHWNPKTFFRYIHYGHKPGVDIKVPWELSRFQHLNILGQAYTLSRDKKYADEFVNQINDWIKHNQVGFGVNWSCAMDVAIRAANWLVAQEYFIDENLIPKEFWEDFYESINEHGKFIFKHLEYHSGYTNNHYISNLVGLFFIAIYCPFLAGSQKWQKMAQKELEKEIDKQVYRDGCSFEASTSYHRLTLELLFYAELLGERAGIEFSSHFKEKVKKMFEFSLHGIKPNGNIPQIGDNDNGRFLIFSKRPSLEHKYLLTIATIYYQSSKYKLRKFDFDEEAFWIFGEKGKKLFDKIPFRKIPVPSKSFPNSGWYILRHCDDYCFISCGPTGTHGVGGHGHNDKLSFELMLNGKDVIVDPGTFVYTSNPELRNRFRSTAAHNVLYFNGLEQNEIPVDNLFSLPEKVQIKVAKKENKNSKISFFGEIQYSDITHTRVITYSPSIHQWRIQDELKGPLNRKAELRFHLSPGLILNENRIIDQHTKKEVAVLEVKKQELKINRYFYSPGYGIKLEANCLKIDMLDYISSSKKHQLNIKSK